MGGRVGMGVRPIHEATKPSNDAAWRVPNSKLARKKALLPVGEGLGWGLDKSAKRQNPVTTPLGACRTQNLHEKKPSSPWGEGLGWGLDKSTKRQNPATTPLGKPSIDAAWRVPNSNLARKKALFIAVSYLQWFYLKPPVYHRSEAAIISTKFTNTRSTSCLPASPPTSAAEPSSSSS